MSLFKVSIEEVESVKPHPNADRLELIKLKGMNWQCVAKKDDLKPDSKVLYYPVDSIIPDSSLELYGLKGKLSGPNKNRVKTIKLRGEISQGLVVPANLFFSLAPDSWLEPGKDVTEMVGVIKYEAPEIICKNAWLNPLPNGVPVYDIEGADNYPEIIEYLMDKEVVITEKLEGTNFSATLDHENKFWVNQRKHTVVAREGEEHTFWKVAKELELQTILAELKKDYSSTYGNANTVTLRGELVGPGIQKNIYGFNKPQLFFFDLLIDGKYLDTMLFEATCMEYKLNSCPLLSFDTTLKEALNGKTVQEFSNGTSELFSIAREGIVIKPEREEWHQKLGRLIIKQRSPEYLAKTDF